MMFAQHKHNLIATLIAAFLTFSTLAQQQPPAKQLPLKEKNATGYPPGKKLYVVLLDTLGSISFDAMGKLIQHNSDPLILIKTNRTGESLEVFCYHNDTLTLTLKLQITDFSKELVPVYGAIDDPTQLTRYDSLDVFKCRVKGLEIVNYDCFNKSNYPKYLANKLLNPFRQP